MGLDGYITVTAGLVAAGFVITNLVALIEGTLTQERLAMRAWVTLVLTWWAVGSGVIVAFWAAFAIGLAVLEAFRR